MNLDAALNTWLTTQTGLDSYWLKRPAGANQAVVYRCISYSEIEGNLNITGIHSDLVTISVYHDNPETGKDAADLIQQGLSDFYGVLNLDTESEYTIQHSVFNGGQDQPLEVDGGKTLYQFNRDFIINHTGATQ